MSSSQQIYNVIQEQYNVHELASSPKPSGMTQVLLVLGLGWVLGLGSV